MNGFLTDAVSLIIEVVFGLYLFALLLRFLMQLTRASFYNPIAQFVVAITNPPLKPLRRLIPGLYGIDLASVLLLLAVQCAQIVALLWLHGRAAEPGPVLIGAVIELLRLTLNVYFYAVILRVLLSWISPAGLHQSPAGSILTSLTEPLMRPARRLIPPIGGLDLSPIAVLLALQLLQLAFSHLLRA